MAGTVHLTRVDRLAPEAGQRRGFPGGAGGAEETSMTTTRFSREASTEGLLTALRAQRIISDDEGLAEEIAKVATLHRIEPDTVESEFIKQGTRDNDIYLILSGKVSVRINGREVAVRTAGYHVGEMAMIDPVSRRSASVVVVESTVLARVSERHFGSLAGRYPQLWRRLALDLSDRLRQRGRFVSSPNPQAVIFIVASKANLAMAREIQNRLAGDNVSVTLWTDGTFHSAQTSVESLLTTLKGSDFAVLLTAPAASSGEPAARNGDDRDNLVFELGLFTGLLGRERTFVVKPRDEEIHIPTHLMGFAPLEYTPGPPETLAERMNPVCNDLGRTVRLLGPV